MTTRNLKKWIQTAAIGMLLAFMASIATAQDAGDREEDIKEAREEAKEAAEVVSDFMKKPDDFIPRELLERAEGIAIFPDVVKAGFIIGGRGGDGVVARRTAGGWSVPVFYNIGGASFGPQIGVKETDYILLFMNDGALRDLLDEKVELSAGASFAAGPVGRTVGAGTNPTLDAGILTWSRSEGAFIGASLKGAVLTAKNDLNRAVYGMGAGAILSDPAKVNRTTLPAEMVSFSQTLGRYAGSNTAGN